MVQVIEALSEVYSDDGIAMWLDGANRLLDGRRGIEVCRTAEGRYRVFALASALAEGAVL